MFLVYTNKMIDVYTFWSISFERGYFFGKFISEYIFDRSDKFLEAYGGCERTRGQDKCKKFDTTSNI